ncbi:OmpA family protein [Nocardiopsis coralliicola]
MPHGPRTAAATLAAAVLLTGCSGGGDTAGSGGGGDGEGAADPATSTEFPFVREGALAGAAGEAVDVQVAVTGLTRGPDATAVDLEVTALGDAVPEGTAEQNFPVLVDAEGRRAYEPLESPGGDVYGTSLPGGGMLRFGWTDVPHTLRIYYPRLEDGAEQVTFAGFGTGAMTGIPVSDAEEIPVPDPNYEEFSEDDPPPDGTPVVFDEEAPESGAEEGVYPVEGVVETEEASTSRTGDTETISLHSDVMFDHDEAEPVEGSGATVAEAAATIGSRRADGDTPVAVTGHTDGTGDDDYNQQLSEDRAEAVAEQLEKELGGTELDVSGRGAEEPVAEEGGSGDDEARAANRRVEITYAVSTDRGSRAGAPGEEGGGGDGEQGLESAELHTGDPAPFIVEEPEPAATQTEGGVRMDVQPLVQDGAFLAATVTLTNEGDEPAVPEFGSDAGAPLRFADDSLGALRLTDGEGTVRYPAQAVHEEEYGPLAEPLYELAPGAAYRAIAYFPAPEEPGESFVLHTGSFGEGELDVPVR